VWWEEEQLAEDSRRSLLPTRTVSKARADGVSHEFHPRISLELPIFRDINPDTTQPLVPENSDIRVSLPRRFVEFFSIVADAK
jgi:hypothetical protein